MFLRDWRIEHITNGAYENFEGIDEMRQNKAQLGLNVREYGQVFGSWTEGLLPTLCGKHTGWSGEKSVMVTPVHRVGHASLRSHHC